MSLYSLLEDESTSQNDPRHWWKSWWKTVKVPRVFKVADIYSICIDCVVRYKEAEAFFVLLKESGMNVISNYFFGLGNSRRIKRQAFNGTI